MLVSQVSQIKCNNLTSCRHDEAIALLLEVIKAAPNLPDAYHTLGLLYEAQGDAPKSVNFFMISAHLSKVQLSLPSLTSQCSATCSSSAVFVTSDNTTTTVLYVATAGWRSVEACSNHVYRAWIPKTSHLLP